MTNFIHENPLGDIELNTVTENGKRCYVTPTGEKYPSVTTVLSNYKKDGIIKWRKRVGDKEANKISTQASRTGTNVHQIAEDYLKNEDNYLKDKMPIEIDMFNKLKPALDNNIDEVYGIEMSLLYHLHLVQSQILQVIILPL